MWIIFRQSCVNSTLFFYFTRTNMNALTLNRYKCPIVVRKKKCM